VKDKSLKDEYKIEAAPDDAEGEVFELRCGGTSPFLTYDDLMKKIEVDPLLQAIVNDRVAQIAARWLRPELMGFKIGELIDLKADTRSYIRDPFFFQWQQHKLQMAETKWKTPIFHDDLSVRDGDADALRYAFNVQAESGVSPDPKTTLVPVYTPEQIYLDEKRRQYEVEMQMAASEMDWEDDEEITQPGLSPRDLEIINQPIVMSPQDLAGGYPSITTEGVSLIDRCYFCATKKNITRFQRSAKDHVTTCVNCLYDHLGWELQSDGTLRKAPADI